MAILVLAELGDARRVADNRSDAVLVVVRRQADDAAEISQPAYEALREPTLVTLMTHVDRLEESVFSVLQSP